MYIKDIVYGDIEIPEKFQAVIDTPEFQRLRRIKQLATANLVFPAANHTRFEHCIGTFHVMRQIVNHFISFFKKLDDRIIFDENDINAVLMAALLHDIGHGPFSHAFEEALEDNFNHEEMTCRIIIGKGTEINKKLKECFGENFPQRVVRYINLRNTYKGDSKTGEGNQSFNNDHPIPAVTYEHLYNNFIWIFHQLVSSQLDADRIDYILRDAKEVGVPFGNFSMNDLISGLQITPFENSYCICVLEDCLNHVEGYLYARYQMYRNIYMNSYKIFTEELLKRIIERARDLYYDHGILSDRMPEAVKCLLDKTDLKIVNFCRLDDYVVMNAILDWSLGRDKILSILCNSFLHRSGFKKLVMLSNDEKDVRLFKKEFLSICHEYLIIPEYSPETHGSLGPFYFWVENIRHFSIYDKNSAKIYIQCNNGLVKEFTEVSSFITAKKETVSAYYISFDLLHNFFNENRRKRDGSNFNLFLLEVERLIDSFNPRRQLEIETKYIVDSDDESIFKDVIDFMKKTNDYVISVPDVFFQQDAYYDYSDYRLNKTGKSIRIRSKNGKHVAAYKKDIDYVEKEHDGNQTIRIEKEVDIDTVDVLSCWPILAQSIPDIDSIDPGQLINILIIKNNRMKYNLSKNNFMMEIVFDDVAYYHGDEKQFQERQIEIELKSGYEYRINLRMFTELLDSRFGDRIRHNFQSKLDRGLSVFLNPNQHTSP
jgi:HD superfamily phosphohydrolase/uncharacterized protein YjbK